MLGREIDKCTYCAFRIASSLPVVYHLFVVMFTLWRWALAEGYGACLINKPELVRDMVKQVRNQVENPRFSVSIKIR